MRKLIMLAIAAMALAIPSIASADVPRYQSQTATFRMIQPADQYQQWANVWTHDFNVRVNSCDGSFSGTGHQFGTDSNGFYESDWTIEGTFLAGDKVSFTAERVKDHLVLSLNNATMDNGVGNDGTASIAALSLNGSPLVTPQVVEEKLSAPVFTNTSAYRNHGEYVKAMGGGADAAHSCIGMPVNSNAS